MKLFIDHMWMVGVHAGISGRDEVDSINALDTAIALSVVYVTEHLGDGYHWSAVYASPPGTSGRAPVASIQPLDRNASREMDEDGNLVSGPPEGALVSITRYDR